MGGNKVKILLGLLAAVVTVFLGILLWQMRYRRHLVALGPLPTTTAVRPSPVTEAPRNGYDGQRQKMVEYQIRGRGVREPGVLQAMESVPRHEFVPDDYLHLAYSDQPLPIGHGQTISQPYIVGLMTELLDLEQGDRVLEIGTGSGYQAAILAELGMEVYSVEIIPELAASAGGCLVRLGYGNVHTLNADGYYGWEEHAPYDAIIVTAAPDHVPQPLVEQLKDGGRMVIPVGPVGWYQTLWLITKEHGEVEYHNKGGVQFVPLTGEH